MDSSGNQTYPTRIPNGFCDESTLNSMYNSADLDALFRLHHLDLMRNTAGIIAQFTKLLRMGKTAPNIVTRRFLEISPVFNINYVDLNFIIINWQNFMIFKK